MAEPRGERRAVRPGGADTRGGSGGDSRPPRPTVFPLRCPVRNYAWGQCGLRSAVAQLVASGDPAASIEPERPYAEVRPSRRPPVPPSPCPAVPPRLTGPLRYPPAMDGRPSQR